MKPALSREVIRARLTGPIASIHTPFTAEGELDERGLQRILEHVIQNGVQTVLLTLGDSLFTVLTDDEVAALTQTVVRQVRGRAMVVAADKPWWTGKAAAFGRYAREAGADMVMVTPPDWAASCTAQGLVDHYTAVAREIPVMVVTAVYIARGAGFALDALRQVRDAVPGVMAVKDDFCGDFARQLCAVAHGQWAVFAGGLKSNFLPMLPYGCDGFMSTLILFRPDITWAFWRAVTEGRVAEAGRIVQEIETPWFKAIEGLPGGFDAGIHGMLELFGLAGRWRRKPYHSLTDAEMAPLAAFCRARGWL